MATLLQPKVNRPIARCECIEKHHRADSRMELSNIYQLHRFQKGLWQYPPYDTLWKILRSYEVPPKFVSLIEKFYNHFECRVTLSNSSSVKSGVSQGCILSLAVIDWVMRKTTSDKPICQIPINLPG